MDSSGSVEGCRGYGSEPPGVIKDGEFVLIAELLLLVSQEAFCSIDIRLHNFLALFALSSLEFRSIQLKQRLVYQRTLSRSTTVFLYVCVCTYIHACMNLNKNKVKQKIIFIKIVQKF